MFRSQPIAMDWHVGEDAYLQALTEVRERSVGPLLVPSERWIALQILRGLLFLVLAVLIADGRDLSLAEQAQQEARAAIQYVLEIEGQAWQNNNRDLYDRLIDARVSASWRLDWRDSWRIREEERKDYGSTLLGVEAHDDLMVASVLITRPSTQWWRSSPYRETRFYRQQGGQWVRTIPQASYWGNSHTLETAHLRFEYFARDAQVVEPTAQRIETIYVALYELLGQPLPKRPRKLTIAVLPDIVPSATTSTYRRQITSPRLARVPADLTDADFLAHLVVGHLTDQALYDAFRGMGRPYLFRWETMYWAFEGWLRTDMLGQRAPWHQQAADAFRTQMPETPLPLSEIVTYWMDAGRPDQAEIMRQYILAESVIAYVANVYGREHLPALVRGFREDGSWEELLTNSVGRSVAEFEQGWNAYLLKTYGAE